MIDNMEYLLNQTNVTAELDFVSNTPIQFDMGEHEHEHTELDQFINKGEYLDPEEWELIDEGDVDYDLEDELDLSLANTSTGTARPNAKSEQDAKIDETNFKVRYQYGGDSTGDREFCKKMLSADKLYRKEDIIMMESKPVNPGFGPKGTDTYSVWKYHGGIYCHHKWVRKTFMSKRGIDAKSPNAPTISTNKAEKAGYRVRNPKQVATRTIDQPGRGEYKG